MTPKEVILPTHRNFHTDPTGDRALWNLERTPGRPIRRRPLVHHRFVHFRPQDGAMVLRFCAETDGVRYRAIVRQVAI
jgi:hypothetical protein